MVKDLGNVTSDAESVSPISQSYLTVPVFGGLTCVSILDLFLKC